MQALKEEVERLQGQAKTLQEDKMKAVQEVEAKQKMVCIKPWSTCVSQTNKIQGGWHLIQSLRFPHEIPESRPGVAYTAWRNE